MGKYIPRSALMSAALTLLTGLGILFSGSLLGSVAILVVGTALTLILNAWQNRWVKPVRVDSDAYSQGQIDRLMKP